MVCENIFYIQPFVSKSKAFNLSSKTRYRLQFTLLKVNGKVVPVRATKAYILNRGIALLIQTFAINGGEWLTSCSSPFTSEKKKMVPTELEAG